MSEKDSIDEIIIEIGKRWNHGPTVLDWIGRVLIFITITAWVLWIIAEL